MNIYRVQVGRIALFLLNTNLPENSPEDREITAQLYGGDQDMRFRQEILLGVGGVRLLRALGVTSKTEFAQLPGIPAIAQGLRLSRRDTALLEGLIRHHARALGMLAAPRPSPREVMRFFREAHAVLPDLLLNAAADLMAEPAAPAGRLQEIRSFTAELLHTYAFAYTPRWQSPAPISGNDLIRGEAGGDWLYG